MTNDPSRARVNDEGSSNAQMIESAIVADSIIIPVSSFLRTSTPLRLGPFVIRHFLGSYARFGARRFSVSATDEPVREA